MSRISFVIPVYRNRGTVRVTYRQIVSLMRGRFPDMGYEFVMVDDGSDDGSLEEILQTQSEDPNVRALKLSRNFGQLAAIVAGLRAVRGNATVVMSADLQDPVDLIGDMIREWRAGNKVVIGYRVSREDDLVARLTSRAFYGLVRLSNPKMPIGGFDYVLMDEKPARLFASFHDRNRFFQGDILSLGFSTKFIPYNRQKRSVGKSQWTIAKKLKYFIDGLLNTSYLPIRFMSLIGILTSMTGLIYACVVAYLRLANKQPFLGYAPIMIVLLLCSGLLMTMLGVIGEYTWRIYDETKGRPLYIVEESYATAEEPANGIPAGVGAPAELP